MLRIGYLREHREEAIERSAVRGEDLSEEIDRVLELDEERRELQKELNQREAEVNERSKRIGELFKAGRKEDAENEKEGVSALKEGLSGLKDKLVQKEEELQEALYHIPNIPHPDVPKGHSDEENEIIEEHEGNASPSGEKEKPHWELGEELGIIDPEAGVKVTGAGFPVYKGKGARLQRALIQWFLDEALDRGYYEVIPPLLVNEASGIGTGQLPDKEGQMYKVEDHDLYLIPTAEVPLINLYRDRILRKEEFPVKVVGHTPCFRREAGSYGKDVRGLNRVHQFDKVEIIRIEHPDDSYQALWEMVEHVKELLKELGLPFRILRLCGGDLGYAAAMTYDLEVYSRAQQKWLEVSSVSNCETYQANRMKLRFQDGKRKELAHTLNGSALALARSWPLSSRTSRTWTVSGSPNRSSPIPDSKGSKKRALWDVSSLIFP